MYIGQDIYNLCKKMFPYNRSITGNGVRKTLKALQEIFSDIKIYEVPSGTKVFDWTVPKEWNIRDAWIKDSNGNIILDFKESNLHVVGYSLPVDKYVTLNELKQMIYTQPDQPDAIPYVTSYYKERSGFCMTELQKQSLKEDKYHVYIDSDLKNGNLTYGEIVLPGGGVKYFFRLISAILQWPTMSFPVLV